VSEDEAEQVLRGSGEDLPARQGSRMKLGRTAAGRYLQVIYVPDDDGQGVFVITAYELRGKAKTAFSAPPTEKTAMSKQNFPPGWDESRVRDVIAHYEAQAEDEQFAEIEAALETENVTLMAVPTELVPEVRALLARSRHS
jgi:hypothetical protein